MSSIILVSVRHACIWENEFVCAVNLIEKKQHLISCCNLVCLFVDVGQSITFKLLKLSLVDETPDRLLVDVGEH